MVVNHHLLLADLALKQEGFGEILPGAQAFIVDEAHQLPELAAQFFGEGLGARPLVELARDAVAECKEVPGALAAVQQPARRSRTGRARHCARRWTTCRCAAPPGVHWTKWTSNAAFEALVLSLAALREAVAPLREAAPGFDACHVARTGPAGPAAALAGRGSEAGSTFR